MPDSPIGRAVPRRDVLALIAGTAGAALAAPVLARTTRSHRGPRSPDVAAAASPCVVRPALTEGPYFVDEKLLRGDIRSDPSDGTLKDGVKLAVKFVVSRLSGASCVPAAGVVVDVWHCDAAGVYSDVRDPRFDTTGRKFLRGYQVTDTSGAASFVTIYPGWYPGRTVHIHFKLRTEPAAPTGLEFTSQAFFDDALTDAVFARPPYATRGARTVRNAGDGIFRNGGSELLLTPADDGTGGYTATFEIAIAGAPAPRADCATLAACIGALRSTLPVRASATGRKARRTAAGLHRRFATLTRLLGRAADSRGPQQAARFARARVRVARLRTATETAASRGTLGVPLAPLEAALDALLAQLPA